MNGIATPVQLHPMVSPLHPKVYFDEKLLKSELSQLFAKGPIYVGHELAIPEVGDFCSLAHEGDGRVLVRTSAGIELLSNVCRHRQAVMLKDRGNTGGNIVCPLHRWTYNTQGKLLGAPHFMHDPCLNLNSYRLRNWNGFLFEDNGRDIANDLAGLLPRAAFDFSGYVLDSVRIHECDYNWKTFIEVYLEDYHVGPFHPGLGRFVTCDDLRWEFKPEYSVQTVGVTNQLATPGSEIYSRWHDVVLKRDGKPPEHGAVWLTYYPHIMVEWYPNTLVVSTLTPINPQKTLNVIKFFYPEEIAAFEREYVEAQQAAYMETCDEDDEIGLRMDAGRKALMCRGDIESGPYQSPMEDGMRHFHSWYLRAMTHHLGDVLAVSQQGGSTQHDARPTD